MRNKSSLSLDYIDDLKLNSGEWFLEELSTESMPLITPTRFGEVENDVKKIAVHRSSIDLSWPL